MFKNLIKPPKVWLLLLCPRSQRCVETSALVLGLTELGISYMLVFFNLGLFCGSTDPQKAVDEVWTHPRCVGLSVVEGSEGSGNPGQGLAVHLLCC